MIDLGLQPRRRRTVLPLQLTAMIDIFAMMIIFLMKGTVLSAVEISVPEGIKLPKSESRELIDPTPRVLIRGDEVQVSFIGRSVPLELLRASRAPGSLEEKTPLSPIREEIGRYRASVSMKQGTANLPLGILADQDTPYQNVFDVVRFFHQEGFETLEFIARGEEGEQ